MFNTAYFILRYDEWVNAIRASSFIENFLKSAQNQSLSSEICSGSSQEIDRSLPIVFSAKLASKTPAKSAVFSTNLSLKIPRNLPFFSRDLPEALQ